MRSQLKDNITLSIFTRDRDLGQVERYANIKVDQWNETADGPVYYASPSSFGPNAIRRAILNKNFDLIYLNSFFSVRGSILPILYFYLKQFRPPIILAPRGEFSAGALMLKSHKKKLFIIVARIINLYGNILWHASTPAEAADIVKIFPKAKGRILVAADPVVFDQSTLCRSNIYDSSDALNIAFISRISPKKNLDGLIRILGKVSVRVNLHIYGPIEDSDYWRVCSSLIASLPENIFVKSHGPVPSTTVKNIFEKYDLFAFPTHGENFGHVIFEALCAGTRVFVSDQTPWEQDDAGALTVIPLHDIDGWCLAITQAALLSSVERKRLRQAALAYASSYAERSSTREQNLNLFFESKKYFTDQKGNQRNVC